MKRVCMTAILTLGIGTLAFASIPGLELVTGSNDTGVIPFTGTTASYSNGNFGGWDVFITLGISNSPNLVPAGLDITNLDAECFAASCANLTVTLSDTGFTQSATGLTTFYSATDTGGSTTQSLWVDTGNSAFAKTDLVGTVSIGPSGGSGSRTLGIDVGPAPYSLTLEDTFTGCAAGSCAVTLYSTDGNSTGVPEPIAVVLFGTVLALCASRLRRRKAV
jgi:hypothetical protein